MSTRIPPSLKWLIDKRARLDAEIRKTERSLGKAKELAQELSDLKETLTAVDRTLGLHDIKIDVNLIEPIHSKYVRIKLPHGELTRSILMCLRLHAGEQPVSTSEIVSFIAARHAELEAKPELRVRLTRSVNKRMYPLVKKGIVRRHHPLVTTSYGLWSLAPAPEED